MDERSGRDADGEGTSASPPVDRAATHGHGALSPADAWCQFSTTGGVVVRTNSYEDLAEGSRFVAVLDRDGETLGWWPSLSWSDRPGAAATMAAIWRTAGGGATSFDDEYGEELVVVFDDGEVRCALDGSHVRVVDRDGVELEEGSAYWVDDEWIAEPEFVMGAITGAACALAGR